MKKLISLAVVLGILFTVIVIPVQADVPPEYGISDGKVRLLGRGEILESGGRTFNWPNSGIEFTFTGTKAEVYVSDYESGWQEENLVYFNVSVDGGAPERKVLEKKSLNPTWFTVYEGEEGTHTIRFVRSSEPCKGTCAFSKIRITGTDIQPTEEKDKFIEFLGDSYTSGYGNLGVNGESYTAENTDNWKSFPGFVARHFDADYTSISYQGKGVIYNGDGYTEGSMSQQFLYNDPYIVNENIADGFNMSTKEQYSFKGSAPDVLVLFLGTNDASGISKSQSTAEKDGELVYGKLPIYGKPEAELKDNFKQAYIDLLKTIRSKYPLTQIIAVSKNSGCMKEEVSDAVAEVQKYDNGLHRLILQNFSGTGVGSHPTVEEHRIIANEIIAKINSIPSIWDAPEIINSDLSLYADYNAKKIMVNGKGNVGDEISALVTNAGKTIADIETPENIVHLNQTTVDKDGDYKFVFDIKEEAVGEGVYKFYLNSYSSTEMTVKDFSFETLIPSVRLEKGDVVVDEISDVMKDENIKLTVSGFDKDPAFNGIVFLAQYDKIGIIKKIDAQKATGGNTELGKEVTINTSVAEGIDAIKVIYINEDNKYPVTGVYVIE